jgi:hypothetical protein
VGRVPAERERVRYVRASKLYDVAARERTLAYALLERAPRQEELEG